MPSKCRCVEASVRQASPRTWAICPLTSVRLFPRREQAPRRPRHLSRQPCLPALSQPYHLPWATLLANLEPSHQHTPRHSRPRRLPPLIEPPLELLHRVVFLRNRASPRYLLSWRRLRRNLDLPHLRQRGDDGRASIPRWLLCLFSSCSEEGWARTWRFSIIIARPLRFRVARRSS